MELPEIFINQLIMCNRILQYNIINRTNMVVAYYTEDIAKCSHITQTYRMNNISTSSDVILTNTTAEEMFSTELLQVSNETKRNLKGSVTENTLVEISSTIKKLIQFQIIPFNKALHVYHHAYTNVY
jgi:hypothetical protein